MTATASTDAPQSDSSPVVPDPIKPPRQAPARKKKAFRRWLAATSRWLHIYLSMLGLGTILFFSATGLTLNHPEWFFKESISQQSGDLSPALLNTGGNPPDNWDEYDFSHEIDKLAVAEFLRAEHHLHGTVTDFLAFEDQCEVTFQGPGYAATARLERLSGHYTVDIATNDLITILNDLHKGRHTGTAWSWVIDISAIIGVVVTLSGFMLIFFLRLKRTTRLAIAAVGSALFLFFYSLATG